MTAHSNTRATPAHPSKDRPAQRSRDVRKDPQDDDTHRPKNSPPNIPTRWIAGFLWQVDPDTPLDELADKYEEWRKQE